VRDWSALFVSCLLSRLVNGRALLLLDRFVVMPLRLCVILDGHAVDRRRLRREIFFAGRNGRCGRLLAKLCERFTGQDDVKVAFRRIGINLPGGGACIVGTVRSVFRGRQFAAEASTATAASAAASVSATRAATTTASASATEIASSIARTTVGLSAIHVGRSAAGRWR